MTPIDLDPALGWVPLVCTLPTAEQPVRLSEFDSLFAALSQVERVDATHATLTLVGTAGLAARARDLTDRETACCSFFTFDVEPASETALREVVRMRIAVPEAHADVLKSLVERAQQQATR